MPPCTYLGVLLAAIVLSSLPPTPVVKFDFQKECLALGTLEFYMLPEQATFAKSLSPLTSSLASSWLLKTSKESGSWLTKTVATTDLTAYFASVSIRGLDAIDCLAFVVVLEFALLLLRIVNASRKSLKSSTREGSHLRNAALQTSGSLHNWQSDSGSSTSSSFRSCSPRKSSHHGQDTLKKPPQQAHKLKADNKRLQQAVRGSVAADTYIRVREELKQEAANCNSIAIDLEKMLLSVLGQYTHYMHETKAASCAMVLALLSAHTFEAELQRKLARANSRADAAEAKNSWMQQQAHRLYGMYINGKLDQLHLEKLLSMSSQTCNGLRRQIAQLFSAAGNNSSRNMQIVPSANDHKQARLSRLAAGQISFLHKTVGSLGSSTAQLRTTLSQSQQTAAISAAEMEYVQEQLQSIYVYSEGVEERLSATQMELTAAEMTITQLQQKLQSAKADLAALHMLD
ncbi:TPA: hypothetical protein ACH3X2_012047 [Trebouxia sp. C0005]